MVAILPVRDKDILDKLNKQEQTDAKLAFRFHDGGEITGYILYSIVDKSGQIVIVNSTDDEMADGLIRSVLASLYDFGINRAEFANDGLVEMARRINLMNADECTVESIKDILYNCKNCDGCNSGCAGCDGK